MTGNAKNATAAENVSRNSLSVSGKAETLAKGLGVSIGKPKEVVENGASYPQPVYEGIRYDAKV